MAELAGSFIVVLCYMCYLWTAKKFCKAYLESSRMQEWVFVLVLFAGWILQNIMSKYCGVPNIVYDLSGHFFPSWGSSIIISGNNGEESTCLFHVDNSNNIGGKFLRLLLFLSLPDLVTYSKRHSGSFFK